MDRLEPLRFALLLDRVFEPLRGRFARIYWPVALPLALGGGVVGVVNARWIRSSLQAGAPAPAGETVLALLLLLGGLLLYAAVSVAAYGALAVGCLDAAAGRPPDMGRAWRFVLRPRTLLTLGFTVFAVGASLVACLFPAIYVAPVLAFVLPVMVEEDRFGWSAVRRSAELAHYSPVNRFTALPWVRALVVLFVGGLFSYSITIVVQLPFTIAQQVLILRQGFVEGADSGSALAAVGWLQVPGAALGALAGAAGWLYWTCGLAALYREVRRLKEGDDLQAAIDRLTGGPPVPQGEVETP